MIVLLIPLVLLGLAQPAAAKWLRMTSPHFELYTDAGEATGKQALSRLEEIRQVFRSLHSVGGGSPVPVRVFLFRSERDFRSYRPAKSTTGFFQSGPQRNYIVMRHAGEQTYRVAFHEYVHLVLNHSSVPLPRWLEEGTAEFYSTMETGRDYLSIGKPIPEHLRALQSSSWLEAGELASVDRDSPYYNEAGKVGIFYAQSWALVHMLNVSPRYREKMPQFASLLEDGTPALGAFEKAFGKTLEEALKNLRAYVSPGRFSALRVGADAREAVSISEARELSAVEAKLAQAELLLHIGNEAAAAKIYGRLARENPAAPEVETGLGTLALSRRDYETARAHLEKAIRLGSRDAQTFFEYAMLVRDSGGAGEEVIENLRKAVGLNPNFAEAHFVLGTLLSLEDRHGEAVEHLRRAASLLPRQAYFWHSLALAHHHLKQREEARRAAYRALQAAATAPEVDMAQAVIRLIDAGPDAPAPDRPEVTTPESWRTKRGDRRAEGTLLRIDCLGASARFYVRTADQTIALYVENPGDVLLRNLSSITFEFRCGPQKPLPVSVEYVTRPDPKHGTDGDVMAIEFR